jgi:methylated-DNA-[protein]-cysteine S-methyltransferase
MSYIINTMKKEEPLFYKTCESPVGKLVLVASNKGLKEVIFVKEYKGDVRYLNEFPDAVLSDDHPLLKKTEGQLKGYFAEKRKKFDVPIAFSGTPFQIKTWNALLKIPYGKTLSYSEQAKLVGDAKKTRAVGSANGRNPIPIIVPCHRVIGKNGSLTGYSGGLEIKEFLLRLEGAL